MSVVFNQKKELVKKEEFPSKKPFAGIKQLTLYNEL
jgi:hypothetical protein